MLKSIEFKKLFGRFDYKIELKEDGITILTGPNGYGKSTILKSIDAMSKGNIFFFLSLEFESIEFKSLVLNKEKVMKIIQNREFLNFNEEKVSKQDLEDEIYELLMKKRDFIYIKRIEKNQYLDVSRECFLTSEDLIQLFLEENFNICNTDENNENEILYRKSSFYNRNYEKKRENKNLEKIMNKMKKVIDDTRFITTERLIKEKRYSRREKIIVKEIDELPKKLINVIREVSSTYSEEANKLDSTYLKRLLNTTKGISKIEYENKVKEMNEKFKRLKKYNLYDIKIQRLETDGFIDEYSKVLKVYFDDLDKKFFVFEDFLKKLELFTNIINNRLRYKKIEIRREKGLVVIKESKSKENEETLKLSQLSSGEQQEIVLFYKLIFETSKNLHILIDEPEISLHIEWQLQFMDDLLKIAKNKKLNITVATHSPQIINNHWDIQIDLAEIEGR